MKHYFFQTTGLLALGATMGVLGVAVLAGEVNSSSRQESLALPSQDDPQVRWWRDSQTNRDERLAWWRDARFGMFVHWGVYSELGNEFHGQKGAGYAEHIQRVLKIPIAVYRREVAGQFNPTNFDAAAWVRLAKAAGMKYLVITAKHHDGVAMWPTKVNDYNVMDATLWHHDPMADLKVACDRYGLKFGFYYSQAFDWGNSNAPGNDWDFNNPGGDKLLGGEKWWETRPEFLATAKKYVDEQVIPQLRELIHDYHPAIFWFDTAHKLPPTENLRIMKAVREADPNVVINGRLVGGWGDYDNTADRPANFPPRASDWEAVPTTDESYGWNPFDQSHKPPSHFIRLLAKAAARGGNVLLNVGPMGDGEIDPKDVAILRGIGDWWRVNGDSIRGTTRTPLPVQTWGESTRQGDLLYLHVFDWPTNGRLVVGGLRSTVKAAWLLAAKTPLRVSHVDPLDVCLAGLPHTAPDKADSVIVLQCAGGIQTDAQRLLQPVFPSDILRAFDGELHGRGLKYGAGKQSNDYVEGWTKLEQSVTWSVRLNTAATYEVLAHYAAPQGSAGGKFSVSFGSQNLIGAVQAGTDQVVGLGRLSLRPVPFKITVTATKINGAELMRLRSLELKPVQ